MYLKIRPTSSTRRSAPLVLALALLFAQAAGCNTASNTGNSSSASANSNSATTTTSTLANISPDASTSSSSDAKPIGLSPTESVRSYYEAGVRNDTASIKRLLSRGSLQMMEEIARREGKTLDQLFSEAARTDAKKPAPAFSNERIKGDVALVDVETKGQPTVTVPLVKEDGEWKLAFGVPKSGATKR